MVLRAVLPAKKRSEYRDLVSCERWRCVDDLADVFLDVLSLLLGAPIGARELVGLQRQAMAAVLDRSHGLGAYVAQSEPSACDVGDDGCMALGHLRGTDTEAVLRDFARRHGIRWLALFGSVLRGEETPASDVDLLVEFEEGKTPGLLRIAELELELGALLGREVELRTYEDLSRYFRDDVRAQARVLYAA